VSIITVEAVVVVVVGRAYDYFSGLQNDLRAGSFMFLLQLLV
jgi:hypothetical protein